MKANEFVKKFGWAKAYDIIARIPDKFMSCYYSNVCYCMKYKKYSDRFKPRDSLVNMAWLKRLVESHDLADRLGGVETVLIMIEQMEINDLCDGMNISFDGEWQGVFTKDQLQQAIADVEACQ